MAELSARTLVPGVASGPLLQLEAPLSFWGGLDVATGRIIDRSHHALGTVLSGAVLMMPSGRGSSSSSSVLAEAIRIGTAPAAIILGEADAILAVGALVARTLYRRACPIVVLSGVVHVAAGTVVAISASETGHAAISF